MNLLDLEEYIINDNIVKAIETIKIIGETRHEQATGLLIKHLVETDNNTLRNEIANALADIGNTDAIKPLITMLSHPKTKGNRGTLLYALEEFDYIEHIDFLVELLSADNFEVSRHALILIESVITEIPIESLQSIIAKLQEKIDFLSEALDLLSQ